MKGEYINLETAKIMGKIERLKELCDKYEEEHKTTFEEWKRDINVINELEKWLIKEKEDYVKVEHPKWLAYSEILTKIKELKENK